MYKRLCHLWFAVSMTLGMLIGVFAMTARADLANGLVSAWLFEEAAGQKAGDSVGSNDGTLEGGAKRVNGKVGKALEFNGADAFVEIPDDETLQIPDAITVAAWVKPTEDNTNNNMAICWKGHHIAFGPDYSWRIATRTTTGLTWGRCSEAGGPEGYWFTFNVVQPNTWHHLALVVDGVTTMKSYVDGEDITGVSGETGMEVVGPYKVYEGEPVEIGAGAGWDGSDNKGYFSGIIDEVLIYDRALTEAELQELAGGASIAKTIAVRPVAKLAITWGMIKQ